MAYLILADRHGEFDRRDLSVPLNIGRALDCDICVRDILLSRHHCRLEPFDDRWIVSDLNSRNGTYINSEKITRHVLTDGDVLRMGKIQVCFKIGAFIAPPADIVKREKRAADPIDASAGTVMGFQLFDMEEDSRRTGFPIPKPQPAEPPSYREKSVHNMVTQIASSSWDMMLSEAEFDATAPSEVLDRNKQIIREKSQKTKSKPRKPRVHRFPPGPLPKQVAEIWKRTLILIAAVIVLAIILLAHAN
jgi:pSer/pThr/pTyr-binding forkhead associated (FHA) protein